MSTSTAQLIERIKEAGQDFEFYPTTNEIIAAMLRDFKRVRSRIAPYIHQRERRSLDSVIDIGAGNGKVLRALKEATDGDRPLFADFYAIEKSTILIEQLPDWAYVVGTEIREQWLGSKTVGVTFSNPPYSEFVEWVEKIIKESASALIYFVIPERWKLDRRIQEAVAFREAKIKSVGEFTFGQAEDREARGTVNLVRVELPDHKDDAFDRFFDAEFAGLRERYQAHLESKNKGEDPNTGRDGRFGSLVVGQNYPDRLVELYNQELDHIRKNYNLVAGLDVGLMLELGISPESIKAGLKKRLADLKNVYWRELLSNMSSVTNRLTSKKRDLIFKKLQENGHVDFTTNNIYAIVIWVLKNANNYIDDQLVETFDQMISKANARNYKSNDRVISQDRWRYSEEKPTHVALEFRLVLEWMGGIHRGYSFDSGLSSNAATFIGDLLTVAHNLGFFTQTNDPRLNSGRKEWTSGKLEIFGMKTTYAVNDYVKMPGMGRLKVTDKVKLESGAFQYEVGGQWFHEKCMPEEPLLEVRAFLNNNLHIRLNQKFALAMNVEVGRLKGWINNAKEAADELGDESAGQFFATQIRLGVGSLPMLGAGTPVTETGATPEPIAAPVEEFELAS